MKNIDLERFRFGLQDSSHIICIPAIEFWRAEFKGRLTMAQIVILTGSAETRVKLENFHKIQTAFKAAQTQCRNKLEEILERQLKTQRDKERQERDEKADALIRSKIEEKKKKRVKDLRLLGIEWRAVG